MAKIEYSIPQTQFAGAWVQDELDRLHVRAGGAMLAAGDFPFYNQVNVRASAAAAAGATSITVDALSGPIPSGTVLDFGGARFARLTAPAAQGATAVTVAALPTALAAGDAAVYAPVKRRFVPSGTLVGRTEAERTAGRGFGPVAVDGAGNATDDEVYLTVYDVYDADANPMVSLYRRDSLVATRYLPTQANLAIVRRLYETIGG